MRSSWIFLFCLTFFFCLRSPVFGMGLGTPSRGALEKVEVHGADTAPLVAEPKVIVATGVLEDFWVRKIRSFVLGPFSKRIHKTFPSAQVEFQASISNEQVQNLLRDANTFGFILVSHTVATVLDTAAMMTVSQTKGEADLLPMGIFSDVTSSLRFTGFIGCHGSWVRDHYSIEETFRRLDRNHRFYYQSRMKCRGWAIRSYLKAIAIDLENL